ncbi:hypothetical protein [Actinoallomurus rhizosphaericola]|uniref:hypothetical protein n=1 Tax=Actinoallomurus rhizosphaericola TaxID=2952536 RepID=UPI002091EAAF|nr:hypothetical protein [Actinoallomurus rhizosphaericola]MCO6000034.1 hypothetical protein [Actinoallomurus rhizosphaericola]
MELEPAAGRAWRPAGVGFVVAFVAGLVASGVLAKTSLYLPDASAAQLREYYTGSAAAVVTAATLQAIAAVCLAWFTAGLARTLVPEGPAAGRVRWAGGASAAAFGASVALSLLLVAIADDAGDGTLTVLGRVTLACGGALHLTSLGILIWLVSRTGMATGLRPRWALRFGLVVAPLLAVSMVSIVVTPVTRLEPLWRLLSAVWLVAMATAGRRRAPR